MATKLYGGDDLRKKLRNASKRYDEEHEKSRQSLDKIRREEATKKRGTETKPISAPKTEGVRKVATNPRATTKSETVSKNPRSQITSKRKAELDKETVNYKYPTAERLAGDLAERFDTTKSPTQRRTLASKDYSDTVNQPKLSDEDRRSLLRERELNKLESQKGLSGFTTGLTVGLTDIDRNNMMSVLGGTNADYERIEAAKDTGAYTAGDIAGSLVSGLIPYGGVAKGVRTAKGVTKAGERIGGAISKIPKVSKETADKLGQGIATSAVTDVIAGVPIDASYAIRQATTQDETGKTVDSKEFLKQLGLYTALNVGAGAAMEAATPAVRRLLGRIPDGQPVLQENGRVRTVRDDRLRDSYAEPVTATQRAVDTTEPVTATQRAVNTTEPVTATQRVVDTTEPVTATQRAVNTTEPVTATQRAVDTTEPVTATQRAVDTTEPVTATQRSVNTTEPVTEVSEPVRTGTRGIRELGADVNPYRYERKISKFRTDTIEKSPMFKTVKDSLNKSEYGYDVVSKKESLDRARQRLEVDFDGEVDDLKNRKINFSGEDLDTAMGIAEVYKREAEETGNLSKLLKWTKLIQEKGTEAGQLIQAFAKYSRDTAEGMLVSAQNKVRKAQEEVRDRNPNRVNEVIKQTDEISNDITKAVDETVVDVSDNIAEELSNKVASGKIKPKSRRGADGIVEDLVEQYRSAASGDITKLFDETERPPRQTPALQELYDDIVKSVRGWVQKPSTTNQAEVKNVLDSMAKSIQNMQANMSEFAEVFYKALDEARVTYAEDEAILAKIDELEQIGIKGFDLKQVSKSIDEVLSELNVSLSQIVKSSGKTRSEILDEVRNTIIKRTGADEATARELTEAIDSRFNEIVSDKRDSMLASILNTRKPSLKSAYQRYAERSNIHTTLISRDSELLKQAIKDSGIEVLDLVKKNAITKSEAKEALIGSIETKLREFDIEESLLADIREQISDSFDKMLSAKAESYLKNRFKDRTVSKKDKIPLIEDILDLINMGAYDRADILDLMRQKNNIPILKADDAAKIVEYMNKSQEATSDRQRDIWRAKAEAIVANYETHTAAEKFIAFLRINMLGNARTLLTRNVGGNLLLSLAENVSEIPASAVDRLVSLKTGQRSITGPSIDKLTAQARGIKKGVKEWSEDVKYGVDTSPARDKYDMAPGSTFSGNNNVSKVLKAVENFIFKALQLGDRPFYQAAYESRLAELKKLGITGEEAELQAKLAGLDRTYQNNTALANTVNSARRALDSSGFPLGSLLIPFSQTPANIMAKMLDYSPVGLASAIAHLGRNAKTGNFDQRLFSQRIGRSFTGTGLLTLGYVLAANGLLVPDIYDSDNYNLYKSEQYSGKVPYSLKVGDKYIGLSSLQPISGVLAMGAEAYDAGVDKNDMLEIASQSAQAGINTFFNQSFIQSILDLMSSETPAEGIKNFLLDIPTRAIPSLSKQLANVTDQYERETADSNPIKELGNKFIAATPGLRQALLPAKRDITGQKIETNQGRGLASKVVENMLLPDTVKKEVKDAVNDEVVALYNRTGREDVLLKSAFKSIRVDGKDIKLTGKQYTEYQRLIGEKAYEDIARVIQTQAYKDMDDETKASVIREINTQAKEMAENQILVSAGKVPNTVWLDGMSETYKNAYTDVRNTSPKKYAEIIGKVDLDCNMASSTDMAVKAMSLASSKADATIYKALDGDKKSGRFYQDMEGPAKVLISKGYTGEDIANMRRQADTDGNGYLKKDDEVIRYLNGLDVDDETKRALFRMLYNTRTENGREVYNPF